MASANSDFYTINETGTIGYAIIVANEFKNYPNLHRCGAEAEGKMLEEIFTKLGFETIIFGDVTKQDFLSKMGKIRNDKKLNEHCIIALAICSHGSNNIVQFRAEEISEQHGGLSTY